MDTIHRSHTNASIRFKEKLKAVKLNLKVWNNERSDAEWGRSKGLRKALEDIDRKMELGVNVAELNSERRAHLLELGVLDKRKDLESSQKIKSKWTLEGDENSKFFHAYLKKRRRVNYVKGIKVNGVWLDDPIDVKTAFFEYHSSRFRRVDGNVRLDLSSLNFKTLSPFLASGLSARPSLGESARSRIGSLATSGLGAGEDL
ncbi:hypothetical protein SSX86_002865 [Deinandra increscens subsp. villosa]|uniref:RNA-directed DNA polymerase, eukaryota n=1 Tax=Deinandra increscens subsp. villosa TaxID=3103831 RepID=A0AAP0HBQ3_9ASTR